MTKVWILTEHPDAFNAPFRIVSVFSSIEDIQKKYPSPHWKDVSGTHACQWELTEENYVATQHTIESP